MKKLFYPLAFGCAVALMPRATVNLPESGVAGAIKLVVQCVQLPGAALGLIVYRNVHSISLWLVDATNIIFYSGLFYLLFASWAKHKTKSPKTTGRARSA